MAKNSICKTKTIYQMEATECGAASLCMIFEYWGRYMSLEQMRVETGVSRDGCAAGNLMRTAIRYGMETHGYKKEPEALKSMAMPCIIHWNFNHFVVLEGFKGNTAYINDPAAGRMKIEWEDFDASFTGIVMTFKPTKSFEKAEGENRVLRIIKQRLHDSGKDIAKLVIAGMFVSLPAILIPFLLKILIDNVWSYKKGYNYLYLLILMLLAIVFSSIFYVCRNKILFKIQNKVILKSAKDFLGHLLRLPISFFEQRYSGDLVNRVSNNDSVNYFMTDTLAEVILDCANAVLFFIAMAVISVPMTGIVVLGIAVSLLISRYLSGQIADASRKLQQDRGKLIGSVTSGIQISSTIRASGAEQNFVSRTLGYGAKVLSTEQKILQYQNIADAFPEFVEYITIAGIVLYGLNQILEAKLSYGMLVAFLMMYRLFSKPLRVTAGYLSNIQELRVDVERVDDIMTHPVSDTYEVKDEKIRLKEKLSGEICCRNLSFGYNPNTKPVVNDISFDIDCGSSIAFVGKSGCGKSTLSKLLSGLYRTNSGTIRIDGKKIEEIDLDVFHASVSTVSQNISFFSGTVRDNLTMWNSAILEQDMINAAKDACIHDVITQKDGAYDFVLTENAMNLSGGQRQRLEIARALVTNPTILIMDEATSALDPIVEKKIIDNIKRRGCTCIVVAHRLSAVRDCDAIAVLENGRIVQHGTHDELSSQDGVYRELMTGES